MGVEHCHALGRVVVPDFGILVPPNRVPGTFASVVILVSVAALLPDLCRPGAQWLADVLFLLELCGFGGLPDSAILAA